MTIPAPACVKTMTVFRTVVTKLRNPKMVSVMSGWAVAGEVGDTEMRGFKNEKDEGSSRTRFVDFCR